LTGTGQYFQDTPYEPLGVHVMLSPALSLRSLLKEICLLDILLMTQGGACRLSPGASVHDQFYQLARAKSLREAIAVVVWEFEQSSLSISKLNTLYNAHRRMFDRSAAPKCAKELIDALVTQVPRSLLATNFNIIASLHRAILLGNLFNILISFDKSTDRSAHVLILEYLNQWDSISDTFDEECERYAREPLQTEMRSHDALLLHRRRLSPRAFMMYTFVISLGTAIAIFYNSPALCSAAVFTTYIAVFALVFEMIDAALRRLWGWVAGPFGCALVSHNDERIATTPVLIAIPIVIYPNLDFNDLISRVKEIAHNLSGLNINVALVADLQPSCFQETTFEEQRAIDLLSSKVYGINIELLQWQVRPIALLKRDRRYSTDQQCWIGQGRKSGKIASIIRLADGYPSELEIVVPSSSGHFEADYVIVVDEDTDFDRWLVERLIRISLHPSNTPIVDVERMCVARGFAAIAVPTSSPTNTGRNIFDRAFGSMSISSPFDARTRDSNFELFGIRQFSGKGLFNVKAAHLLICDQLNSDKLLSHDYIEGAILRTGHCAMGAFEDNQRPSLRGLILRRERWNRGDLQNFFTSLTANSLLPVGLPLFGHFLVLDNARRAMLPLFGIVAVVCSATSSRQSLVWFLIIFLIRLYPHILLGILNIVRSIARGTLYHRPRLRLRSALEAFFDEASWIAVLPITASVSAISAIRALSRIIRGRNLLQWTTSRSIEASSDQIVTIVCLLTIPVVLSSTLWWFSTNAVTAYLGVVWSAISIVGLGIIFHNTYRVRDMP
jgi:hypothetical protein